MAPPPGMETVLGPEAGLRFHQGAPAAVTALAAPQGARGEQEFPAPFVAAGLAPVLRGWRPAFGAGEEPRWEPAGELAELDGRVFHHVKAVGDTLVAVDASPEARVWMFDLKTWERGQVLDVEGTATCFDASGPYVAVGLATGRARVWAKRPDTGEWIRLFDPDLKIDGAAVHALRLQHLGEEHGTCLVAHKAAAHHIGVWRLGDGKLLHAWGGEKSALPLQRVDMVGPVLVSLSWRAGEAPQIHMIDVLSGEGGQVPPRAGAAGGEPLCSAFNGRTYVVGFSGGLVAAVGHHKWENHRPGAVGVVSAVNSTRLKHTGFVTGGADGTVTFWSEEGAVLSALDLGFQVTALSVHSLYALVGGAAGELDLVSLLFESECPAVAEVFDAAAEPVQYRYHFDARPVGGPCGADADHPEYFQTFRSNRPEVESAAAADGEGASAGPPPEAAESAFSMSQALAGAGAAEGEVEAAAEAPQKTNRQVGEDAGVARKGRVVLTSSAGGQECSSPSCINREAGTIKFKRCAGCKVAVYCSAHCQKTHWKSGHKAACKALRGS